MSVCQTRIIIKERVLFLKSSHLFYNYLCRWVRLKWLKRVFLIFKYLPHVPYFFYDCETDRNNKMVCSALEIYICLWVELLELRRTFLFLKSISPALSFFMAVSQTEIIGECILVLEEHPVLLLIMSVSHIEMGGEGILVPEV